MKHRICARGIAAASLALAANSASAAQSVRTYVDAIPGVPSPARGAADLVGGGTVPISPNVAAVPEKPAQPVQRALVNSVSEAEPASANAGKQSLGVLVRAHAAAVLDEESECLAVAVYFEARGEPIEGQLAVAEVVLNRVASGEYPASICAVVKQPAQFSFVRKGDFPRIDASSPAWRTAVGIAHVAGEKLAKELGSDVLWYHAEYVAPAWAPRLARETQIGAHIFYRRG